LNTTDNSGEHEPHILFELAGATYALRSQEIQQLEMVGSVTPVPNAPPFVAGVVSVRGQAIPALDLRARFGFPAAERSPRSRLIVARAAERTVGLIVDSAREFARLPPAAIQSPPDAVAGTSGRYLRGIVHVGERLVLVLDMTELLRTDVLVDAAAGVAPAAAGEER
jgi:purine-binding chemotaxis protein CheW